MFSKYVLVLSTVFILSIGQLLLKKGIVDNPATLTLPSLLKTLFSPFVMLGFFFYGIASIMSIYLFQKLPLSIALPSMSLTYVIILFASAHFFGEKITDFKLAGVAFIILGVILLSRSQ